MARLSRPMVGRLGSETAGATEQPLACQCPTPRHGTTTSEPRAPSCHRHRHVEKGPPASPVWSRGRLFSGASAVSPAPEDAAEPRWLLLLVVGGPGYMGSESVAVRLRGQGIRRHKRHIALYSPFSYLGFGRIRFTTRGRTASSWPQLERMPAQFGT